MEQLPFIIDSRLLHERRTEDRRQIAVLPSLRRRPTAKTIAVLTLILLLAISIWKWRYVVYGPVWVARAYWADRSDLYQGTTNGYPNKDVVWQARNYLSQIKKVDAAGNLMAPEALRSMGIHLSVSWFNKHHPEVVDYNPFAPAGVGPFVVSWLYVPGCQKAVWRSSRLDADWYDPQGQPCYGVCRVSVFMDSHLKLTALKLDPIPYL